MQFSARMVRAIFATMALVVFSACGTDDIVDIRYEPQVLNATDDFSFQAVGFLDITQTSSYTWQNTGTIAKVDRSSLVTLDSGTLTIIDANGTQVYSAALTCCGTVETSAGTAGSWTIRVALTNSSGTAKFRVQRGG
jgi:hypothetical protein